MSRLLMVIVTLAALAVVPAREGSALVTLYREPKALALTLGTWIWLAALFASARGSQVLAALPRVATARPVLPWLLWVLYMALTTSWGAVTDNAVYELRTLLPAALWMAVLLAWQRVEPRAEAGLRRALIVALAAVSAVGALQLLRPLPFLPPIHPELGGPHASTFGFKNPAALAVLGQWFLVLYWVLVEKDPRRKAVAATLCLAEAVYIASLHSRTALLALVAGLLFLGAAAFLRRGRPASRTVTGAALGGAVAIVAVVALVAPWRERALSGARLLAHPASYLESDRGIYLRNTLAMVERHPAGVGLGDWQTYYPIFRRHARDFAFDQLVEVRRAHSDHVQILGEGGWPGLALWLVALGSTLVGGLRLFRASGDLAPLLVSAQLVAWTVAMGTDYVTEMPFHRFQLFFVVALALSHQLTHTPAPPPSSATLHRGRSLALAVLLGLVALTETWRGGLLLARQRAAAFMGQTYQQALRDDPSGLRRALDFGERMARLPGYTKTTPHDERILAHLYWLHGAEDRALFWLRRGVDHQPYAPAGLDLAARLLERRAPEAAAEFARARDYVIHEARGGYDRPYPEWPEQAADPE